MCKISFFCCIVTKELPNLFCLLFSQLLNCLYSLTTGYRSVTLNVLAIYSVSMGHGFKFDFSLNFFLLTDEKYESLLELLTQTSLNLHSNTLFVRTHAALSCSLCRRKVLATRNFQLILKLNFFVAKCTYCTNSQRHKK